MDIAKFKNIFFKKMLLLYYIFIGNLAKYINREIDDVYFQYNIFRSSHRSCSEEKLMFLEISQNPQENACTRVSLSREMEAKIQIDTSNSFQVF